MLNHEKILSLVTNRFLELIILPTEQCNFRCTYCYEDFLIGKMKRNTVEAIKKLLELRVPNLDVLKISWFGGEPLAAKDIVYEISDFIITLQKKYPRFKYISGMTTNAFLLKEDVLKKLISHGISSYQISLDGTEEMHNQTRIRLNGQGTFNKIWDNLLSAKNTNLDFTITIRIHITPDNVEDVYLLVDQLKFRLNRDKRFSVFFKAIENLGGPKTGSFKVVQGKDKSEILENFYSYLGEELRAKKLDDNGPYVCYAAQTNSFMIRADGKIGKCTVAFSDDRNILGKINDDGTVEIISDKLALWTRGIKSQNKDELRCPMYKIPIISKTLNSIPVKVIN